MAKKRRTKEQIARSERAKRGWITRRQNKADALKISNAARLVRNALKGVKGKKNKKKVIAELPKLPKKKKLKKRGVKRTVEELEALLDLRDKQLEVLQLTKDWEHAMPPEYLHPDGTIALYPCRARHWGPIADEMKRMMRKAKKKSETEFDRTVAFLAGFYNMPMREVYTLWFS